jgi:hypothetical protein
MTLIPNYNNHYVHLNLNLHDISSHDNFIVIFFVEHEFKKGDKNYDIKDYSK